MVLTLVSNMLTKSSSDVFFSKGMSKTLRMILCSLALWLVRILSSLKTFTALTMEVKHKVIRNIYATEKKRFLTG